jgi:Kelch motif
VSRGVVAGLLLVLAVGVVVTVSDGEERAGEAPERGVDPRAASFDRWVPLRSAGLARTEVAAARVGNFIYVVGGFVRAANATVDSVERYDIARNRWSRVRDMPIGLNHPAATSFGGDVYVVGGYTADASLAGETDAFLRYDPERTAGRACPACPRGGPRSRSA